MMNGDRKEGICRLNVDGNGCDYLRILSDLEPNSSSTSMTYALSAP